MHNVAERAPWNLLYIVHRTTCYGIHQATRLSTSQRNYVHSCVVRCCPGCYALLYWVCERHISNTCGRVYMSLSIELRPTAIRGLLQHYDYVIPVKVLDTRTYWNKSQCLVIAHSPTEPALSGSETWVDCTRVSDYPRDA